MKNIDSVATELANLIPTACTNVSVGDKDAQTTEEDEKARIFNFDYVSKDGENFGNVIISIVNELELKIYFGKNITDKLNEAQQQEWYGFLRRLRMFAKRKSLGFKVDDISRGNFELKDIKKIVQSDSPFKKDDVNEGKVFLKVKNTTGTGMNGGWNQVQRITPDQDGFYIECEPGFGIVYTKNNYQNFSLRRDNPTGQPITGEQASMLVNESKFYGSKKKSYQDIGKAKRARLVIKHDSVVDGEVQGSRSRHVESVFVETSDGERFKLPFTNLTGARAMGNHVAQGGHVHDDVGTRIGQLVQKKEAMRKFVHAARNKTFESEDAVAMVESAIAEYNDIHSTLNRLKGPKGYKAFVSTFKPEDDEDGGNVEELKEKFSRKVFDERLEEALPHVYRAHNKRMKMQEEQAVEEAIGGVSAMQPKYRTFDSAQKERPSQEENKKRYDERYKEQLRLARERNGLKPDSSLAEADEFEQFMNNTAGDEHNDGKGDDVNPHDENELKEILSTELNVGPEGVNALGIVDTYLDDEDTTDLEDAIYHLAMVDPDSDASPVIKDWIKNNIPGLYQHLGLDADEAQPAAQPQAQAAPAPAQQDPNAQQPAAPQQESYDPIAEMRRLSGLL